MEKEWMPHTRTAQLAMAKRWIKMLPDREKEWQIPKKMIKRMRELAENAEALHTIAESIEGTKEDDTRMKTAFHELVAYMKDIRAQIGFYTAADGSGLYRSRFPVRAS